MELGALLEEFLDQPTNVGANAAGVDVIIVVNVLERENGEEVVHAAELVLIQARIMDRTVANLREGICDSVSLPPQPELRHSSVVSVENIAEIGPPISALLGSTLQPLELSQSTGHTQV